MFIISRSSSSSSSSSSASSDHSLWGDRGRRRNRERENGRVAENGRDRIQANPAHPPVILDQQLPVNTEDQPALKDLAPEDEEFVSCQICFRNFDEKEHLPKYLAACYHFFCLTCLHTLVKGTNCRKKITCPLCRETSVLARMKCEELATNHMALRLLKVIEESQKREKEESNQQWCTECNSEATTNCKCSRHQLGNFDDACTSSSLILKETIIKSNSACDQALQGCRQIQCSHEVILARIQWLKTEMSKKVSSINTRIAHLESLKSEDYGVDASNEKDMTATMDKIIQLVNKVTDNTDEAKAADLKAQNYLQTYGTNDLDFLITLLKEQETNPSENFTSSSNSGNSSRGIVQDIPITPAQCTSSMKIMPTQSQIPKRLGEERAVSATHLPKNMQGSTDQLTENMLCKVHGVAKNEVTDIQKPQVSNNSVALSAHETITWKNDSVFLFKCGPTRTSLCGVNNISQFQVDWFKCKQDIYMPRLFHCNNCKNGIGHKVFIHCFECEDFQLCVSCSGNIEHKHKNMEKFGFDLINDDKSSCKIQLWVESFFHVINCVKEQCTSSCEGLKRTFVHNQKCQKRLDKCSICKQLVAILICHAKSCFDKYCRVPHCRSSRVRYFCDLHRNFLSCKTNA